jgi:biotin carboxyl carrier protein
MKRLNVTVEGKTYEVEVELLDEGGVAAPAPRRAASSGGSRVATPVAAPKPKAAPAPAPTSGAAGAIPSPLAAVVVSIDVNVGDTIEEGQKVVTLEAMKMNTIVAAPAAGTVKSILVKPGDGVEEGQALVEVA